MVKNYIVIGTYFAFEPTFKKFIYQFVSGFDLPQTYYAGDLDFKLKKIVKIPIKYRSFFLEQYKHKPKFIGSIVYSLIGDKRVVSTEYYPKVYIREDTRGSGLGSFLELLALQHLKKSGFVSVQTTMEPSEKRQKQVEKANLKKDTPYSPEKWQRGIASVVRKGRPIKINRK